MIINKDSTWTVFFKNSVLCSPLQIKMAVNLLDNILKPMLEIAGGSYQMSSGVRDPADIRRLIVAGYHPSLTSDHLFGVPVPTAGACDVIPACGVVPFFDYIKTHCDRDTGIITLPDGHTIKVGQIIRERGKTAWLHISNPRKLFFPTAAGKPTLLISDDNGLTYQNA